MNKKNIVCTCGASNNVVDDPDKMKDTLLSEIFYKKYSENKNISETIKYVVELIPKDKIYDLEENIKNILVEAKDENDLRDRIDNEIEINENIGELLRISRETIIDFFKGIKEEKTKRINKYLNLSLKYFLRSKSAECNSIEGYISEYLLEDEEVSIINKIYILASDSEKGYESAKKSKEFIKALMKHIYKNNNIDIYVDKIEGFKTGENTEKFIKDGIRNLLMKFFDIHHSSQRQNHKCILNITGGYRAAVPYAVYFASGFDLDIFYLYDASTKVMVLPRIPIVSWDEGYLRRLKDIKEAFSHSKRKGMNQAKNKGMLSLVDKKEEKFSDFGDILIDLIEKKLSIEGDRENLNHNTNSNRNRFISSIVSRL
ncbi:MAG: hypothetical protein N4A57_00890 [Anaeromicrobium sp.]|jgi:CRISPR/Cas system-associated protein Csm6|uniref:hypothetical protein n=1 Tax=Anaeromicrobium sp. TaxID=1929132 RepID=UPI0025D6CD64|nr:hypothetical protein [Anaeromicrobium sp.]MCT4592820.1 hypothetical protein [Anaeromicrobium sp.]